MFYLNKDIELTPSLLQKMINRFQTGVYPHLKRYWDYYNGKQRIYEKAYSDPSKPCNKTVINYCKNIADSYCGYIASPRCIGYSSDNDISEIMDILRYNDYQEEDSNFLLNGLIYGTASELMFIDGDGKTRFNLVNPLQCFGIFDDTLTCDLLYFVRWYKVNDWDESDTYKVDVYTDNLIRHYEMGGLNGYLSFKGEEPHYFGQCPANIFFLANEKSIFDCVMSEQDSVNDLLSAEIDDYSAFCDAYLSITGCDADSEDIQMMKENRVLILPEGAEAQWLTKNANDAQVENILKRLHDSIYRIAQCPDFSSETFVGGVSSGIAIRYRLTGMETRAGMVETSFKKALQRRIEIIAGIASLKLGEEVFRDINITFTRNIPTDNTDVVNIVNALKGTVSEATLLAQIPFVSDVNKELETLNKEKEQNLKIYDFGE